MTHNFVKPEEYLFSRNQNVLQHENHSNIISFSNSKIREFEIQRPCDEVFQHTMTHSYSKQTPDEVNLLAPEKIQRVELNEAVLNHDIDQNRVAVNKRQFESFDAR